MKSKRFVFFILTLLLFACKNEHSQNPLPCGNDGSMEIIQNRQFHMGFTTWSFGPTEADREITYQFISQNADIYSEQIDNKIPWNALINNTELPAEFVSDISYRVSKKPEGHKLLLSVSLLNTDRADLLEDYDGTIPSYSALNEPMIENAYVKHLEYLIVRFNPDYVVTAMEVNELKMKSEVKWTQYKLLMSNIRSRIKNRFPELKLSESVTLHNWFNPDVQNPNEYMAEIANYVNQNLDFAAISFYPFFKGLHSKEHFQIAFDFVNTMVAIPVAFVETSHLAEKLEVSGYSLVIESNKCEQKDYLEVLLLNAHNFEYEFLIWWTHRDFDWLWETFPPEVQDLGKLWRDTGLLDENGEERPAYLVWKEILSSY